MSAMRSAFALLLEVCAVLYGNVAFGAAHDVTNFGYVGDGASHPISTVYSCTTDAEARLLFPLLPNITCANEID
ncbi:MAG: hypothetical protein AAFY60_17460, partial [Myxococcota bacterium]